MQCNIVMPSSPEGEGAEYWPIRGIFIIHPLFNHLFNQNSLAQAGIDFSDVRC